MKETKLHRLAELQKNGGWDVYEAEIKPLIQEIYTEAKKLKPKDRVLFTLGKGKYLEGRFVSHAITKQKNEVCRIMLDNGIKHEVPPSQVIKLETK